MILKSRKSGKDLRDHPAVKNVEFVANENEMSRLILLAGEYAFKQCEAGRNWEYTRRKLLETFSGQKL